MKLKRTNLVNPPTKTIMIKKKKKHTLKKRDFAHINQIKIENSDCSITVLLNEISVWYKIYTRAQCNAIPLTILKRFDFEYDLYPLNIKLFSYNNFKIPALRKCSLTPRHKKTIFIFCFWESSQNPCLFKD